jgi:ABC-2 type transport system permease protein
VAGAVVPGETRDCAPVVPDVRPGAWGRITGVMLRQMYLYKRTLHRWLEAVYWPVLDITLWGFLAAYIDRTDPSSRLGFALLGTLISWDIMFRAQQSVSVGFLEDMWSRNVLNVWSTPIRAWEYVGGTILVGILRVAIGAGIAVAIAAFAFGFDYAREIGLPLVPFLLALLIMGWSVGVATTAMILRLGQGAEELAWALAFLFQPFSAVFYPVSVLPGWMRAVSFMVPASHVFEGMRGIILHGAGFPVRELALALAVDVVYVLAASWLFSWSLRQVRARGLLSRFGE